MQLINALEGGKLIQDLDNGNARHKKEASDKEHAIVTEQNTFLHEVAGALSGHVNSAHHQAIDPDAIGENLVINAYDDDEEKIIEGLEFRNKHDKGFMLCVQWHPERIKDKEHNPFSQNLKDQFLSAIRKTDMKKLSIINPATEEVITELNVDTQQSLQKKLESLKAAQLVGTKFLFNKSRGNKKNFETVGRKPGTSGDCAYFRSRETLCNNRVMK
jgi:hypothetical protein